MGNMTKIINYSAKTCETMTLKVEKLQNFVSSMDVILKFSGFS